MQKEPRGCVLGSIHKHTPHLLYVSGTNSLQDEQSLIRHQLNTRKIAVIIQFCSGQGRRGKIHSSLLTHYTCLYWNPRAKHSEPIQDITVQHMW